MFKLTVYKTLTSDFEDFEEVEEKQFSTLEEAEKYAADTYDLSPVSRLLPHEYSNGSDAIAIIEKF